jgi:hypothetical protein
MNTVNERTTQILVQLAKEVRVAWDWDGYRLDDVAPEFTRPLLDMNKWLDAEKNSLDDAADKKLLVDARNKCDKLTTSLLAVAEKLATQHTQMPPDGHIKTVARAAQRMFQTRLVLPPFFMPPDPA